MTSQRRGFPSSYHAKGTLGAAMDPEISIMFQCPFQAGFTEDMVRVEISPRYNRCILPEYEPQIAAIWENCCRNKPWLFNGSKFRVHSVAMERGVLIFRFGLTCYRDFIGTNWSSQAAYLQQQGQADFEDSQAYLAEPLGVGAMLHTADDYFVFLRRSLHVGEAPGLIDIPGGHPEPKAVARGVPEELINLDDLPEDLVVKELFSSILVEIRDEVNLPLSTLSQPVLLGLARNTTSAGRASAEFYVRCSLIAEQVKQFYLTGGPEAEESTSIVFMKRQELLKLEENRDVWKELCPSAKGGVKLFLLVCEGCS
ncbi:uridine diphosphate glucose pyrophosphatase NUDT22 isoform X1 [Microcaecilia unicolor]|uniref:Uridine diphosphate glucose pyrophosphatase isoform X1 n=2 Tax=Microcaecilia unicolor TaxID=1415580 RepID=A0A6P7ZFZ2_9AMPH|nr:uridine diphosphate glucose pyrophosphatase isoform X1 [Microcaecilia unicolor]